MKNTSPLLTSPASLMVGRQRLNTRLEIGPDKVLRLYNTKDDVLLFESPVKDVHYSHGKAIKSRLRIVGPQNGMRLGVQPVDEWIKTLKDNGAKEDPNHPEEKIDRYGMIAFGLCLIAVIAVFIIALSM